MKNLIYRIAYNKNTNSIVLFYPVIEEFKDTDYRINNPELIGYIDVDYSTFFNAKNLEKPSFVNPQTKEIIFEQYTAEEYEEVFGVKDLKENKINELRNICEEKIVNEFYSNCLGEVKQFDCTTVDQLNIQLLLNKAQLIIQGIELEDSSLEWKASGELEYYPWTPQQVVHLGVDLSTHINSKISKYQQLRIYINDSNRTVEEINNVNWDTVI